MTRATTEVQLADDLRVVGIRALTGPNVWRDAPVVVAELRLDALADHPPASLPGFQEGIGTLLSTGVAAEHDWGHLLVLVTNELQRRAGSPQQFGRVTGASSGGDGWMVAVGFDEEELAVAAIRDAARMLRDCIRGEDMEIRETVDKLIRTHELARPNAAMRELIARARARDIPVRRNPDNRDIQFGLGATLRIVGSADAPEAGIDALYPEGAPVRIPIVAITGTNGKTTTTRLIAHIFRAAGHRVGYTTTDGMYFQEELLMEGDFTGPFAANAILSHEQVEVAVLETARGGMLRSGLGYAECDVGIVTNVTSDHLGLRDIHTLEQLADVKAVVAAAVRPSGHTVLNADDPLVHPMSARTKGTVVFFSLAASGSNSVVEEHLRRGGTVTRVERVDNVDYFVIRERERLTVIAPVAGVPLTFGGLARFQFGNVLAAVAAAFVSGVPVEMITAALATFVPSAEHTPGRLNVVETDRGRVILDYAHNAAAIAGLLDFVSRLPARRRIAMLTAPGDRRDEDLREVGRLAAAMDFAILKEHPHYRRGREPGEVARIIGEGLLATGFPSDRAAVFNEEHDAVAHLISIMRPGDVVAVIADDLPMVMDQLRPYVLPSPQSDSASAMA